MPVVPDPKLIADAREAVGFASMLMDKMPTEPNRDQVDIAQRAVSLANAKLVEYQCQVRNAPRKHD